MLLSTSFRSNHHCLNAYSTCWNSYFNGATILSTISLNANLVMHSRTKHFELDSYFVHEKAINRMLKIRHVPSCDQTADILTKLLHAAACFQRLRFKLSVILNSSLSLQGKVK